MIKVLIVEDSPTLCLLIKSILEADPEIKVIDIAHNGEEGVLKTVTLNPDLVTMDIHMPGIDGFEATRRIMAQTPRPIIIVTSSLDQNEVKLSFRALEAGALVVIEKPSGPNSPRFQQTSQELIKMVKLMADVKVVGRRFNGKKTAPFVPPPLIKSIPEIIGIGVSTGGPAALATILGNMPLDFRIPILIVQHIAVGFDEGLAEWLSSVTRRKVSLAINGQAINKNDILIAPQGKHMGVDGTRHIILDYKSEAIGAFRPSASYLFHSIARVYGSRAVGLILTGMGNDGTSGLLSIHAAGGFVIAQNEATSVVYGMPGSAVAAGAVDQVLPLDQIAPTLTKLLILEVNRES
ncbi:MAG: chemotaxis-specific protein-glutamate methyltransferase CheB [Anaerolineae bacterium]|nr:chemotaxis-specific protein-glutamate methyltransferase CheB [Anaerolineae bacterium]